MLLFTFNIQQLTKNIASFRYCYSSLMLSNLNFFTWKINIRVSAFILAKLLAFTAVKVCLTAEGHHRMLKRDPHLPVSTLKVLNKYGLRSRCFGFFSFSKYLVLIFVNFINTTNETQLCYYNYSQAQKKILTSLQKWLLEQDFTQSCKLCQN